MCCGTSPRMWENEREGTERPAFQIGPTSSSAGAGDSRLASRARCLSSAFGVPHKLTDAVVQEDIMKQNWSDAVVHTANVGAELQPMTVSNSPT